MPTRQQALPSRATKRQPESTSGQETASEAYQRLGLSVTGRLEAVVVGLAYHTRTFRRTGNNDWASVNDLKRIEDALYLIQQALGLTD